MNGRQDNRRNRKWGLLVQAELPHDTVNSVVLDVDVVDKWPRRPPVLHVPIAQRREVVRGTSLHLLDGVGSPPHASVDKSVELTHEVRV